MHIVKMNGDGETIVAAGEPTDLEIVYDKINLSVPGESGETYLISFNELEMEHLLAEIARAAQAVE